MDTKTEYIVSSNKQPHLPIIDYFNRDFINAFDTDFYINTKKENVKYLKYINPYMAIVIMLRCGRAEYCAKFDNFIQSIMMSSNDIVIVNIVELLP